MPNHPYLDGKVKKLLIGGRWLESRSGGVFSSINPSTGRSQAQIAQATAEDVDLAVNAAREAFEGPWSQFSPYDRQCLMLKIAEVIEREFDSLGLLETLDMGAPIARTRMFKRWMLQAMRYYAAQAVTIRGETIENSVPGTFISYTIKQPLGVVGGIIPWNGPLVTQLWSICPTLATGCTLVLKPAEEAALSALRLAELMTEAGVPDGVINVVPGPGSTAGAALAAHPLVDKIAFTGSTVTGRKVVEASIKNMKRVAVELGGKSPDIIFDDANLELAVPGAAMGCFGNSGQVCYAGTRLFVQNGIYKRFVGALTDFTRQLRVGDSLDPATNLGPLVSEVQLSRVQEYLRIGAEEGAELAVGGKRLGGELAEGYFIEPTILAGVRNDMRVAREEIFGPVLAIIPFDDEIEVVRMANETAYGLGGAVWTTDIARAHRVSRAIRSGMMWVNCYGITEPTVPYGSARRLSGYGTKGGPHHVDEYLADKAIWIRAA
jgi:aldehyde dehydrogenase (NAD+)